VLGCDLDERVKHYIGRMTTFDQALDTSQGLDHNLSSTLTTPHIRIHATFQADFCARRGTSGWAKGVAAVWPAAFIAGLGGVELAVPEQSRRNTPL